MSTFARRSNVITQTRQAASQLLDAYDKLVGLSTAWNNGVKAATIDATGTDPKASGYQANDFAGHEGLVKADINQALGTALTALIALVNSTDGKKWEDIRN
jgi:hypothetical protein